MIPCSNRDIVPEGRHERTLASSGTTLETRQERSTWKLGNALDNHFNTSGKLRVRGNGGMYSVPGHFNREGAKVLGDPEGSEGLRVLFANSNSVCLYVSYIDVHCQVKSN